MLGAIFGFISDILFDLFFNTVCTWTGEIILFVVTLSNRQPDFEHASHWSPWLGLTFWIAIAAGIVFVLLQTGVLKF